MLSNARCHHRLLLPWLFSSLLLLLLFHLLDGANVLISPSWLSPVHRFTMRELAAELVRRNHSVTWLEYGLQSHQIKLPKGVEEIFLQIAPKDAPHVFALMMEDNNNNKAGKSSSSSIAVLTSQEQMWRDDYWQPVEKQSGWFASMELCRAVLEQQTNRRALEQLVARQFAVVVIDDLYNPCALLHAGLQKSLFIYWSMTGMRTESAWANQSPSPPSYIPVPGTGLTDELSFLERAYNMLAYLRELYIHQHIVLRRMDKLFQRHFPNNQVADAFTLERNASLNFVNNPPIFDFARPYMPRVNFVGGLHCRNQSLNKWGTKNQQLLQFVNASSEARGFILISGGFSLQWAHAPPEVIANLMEAIRQMSDIRFVWQYNGPALANPPANLFTAEWLPQQKLLAHPKCRAHLNHGGLNSVIESVWHGVPMIGWPLTAHARDNLLRVTARQAGLMLAMKRPSVQQFVSVFHRIYIRFYREEMAVFQDMLIDVPYTELNHSAFWVEFIVRHQEVPHARSGADELNIFQYFLVDVVLFLVGVALLALYLLLWTLKLTLRAALWLLRLPFMLAMKGAGRNGKQATNNKTTATKKKNAKKND